MRLPRPLRRGGIRPDHAGNKAGPGRGGGRPASEDDRNHGYSMRRNASPRHGQLWRRQSEKGVRQEPPAPGCRPTALRGQDQGEKSDYARPAAVLLRNSSDAGSRLPVSELTGLARIFPKVCPLIEAAASAVGPFFFVVAILFVCRL